MNAPPLRGTPSLWLIALLTCWSCSEAPQDHDSMLDAQNPGPSDSALPGNGGEAPRVPGTMASGPAAGGSPSGAEPPSAVGPAAPSPQGDPTEAPSSDEVVGAPVSEQPDGVPAMSRARRIAPSDFDRVLSDLLGMPVSVASSFPEEIAVLDGYHEDDRLLVTDRLRAELSRTAEALAQALRDDAAAIERLLGCATQDAACRDQFVDRFVSRAYRRPITEEEGSRYRQLFDAAAELIGSGDAFADGVQLVVEATLQSPKFLYRIEQGSGESDAVGELLTDHEVASRLSFLILGTMPDDELLAAAAEARVHTSEQIAEQATRLLQDPRVADRVQDFHDRYLQLEGLASISKDPALFPPFGEALVRSMRAEARRFVEEVTLVESGGIRRLLTAPYGFADRELAAVYGFEVTGSELERVDHPADSPRAGVLTQAAFLSGHSSSSTTTSPILRGRFVLERILCFEVPEPPPNAASEEPPAPEVPPVTTRQMFEWKTSMDTCVTCHSIINPTGFAFEAFDAIGRFRTEENGAPVDASGTALFPESFGFADTREFLTQLADFAETRVCYAKNWLRFGYGRRDTADDLRTLATLAQGLERDDFGARDVLLTLTRSAAFSHLAE